MKIFKNPTEEKKVSIFKNPSPEIKTEPVPVAQPEPELIEEEFFVNSEEYVSGQHDELVEIEPIEEEDDLVHAAAKAIHNMGPPKGEKKELTEKLQYADMDEIRRMLNQIRTQGNLSWGGGGTGVVRFVDLDDHQHPRDIRYLEFHPEGTDLPAPSGSLAWNPEEDCLDVHQADGTVCQVGLEQYIRVHNMTGADLDNGTVVSFAGVMEPHNGYTEHVPMAGKFIADNSIDPLHVIGVMTETLANGENGRATTFGKVRDLDTTGAAVSESWALGDLLWGHPTIPGALTKVRPTAPNMAISIAAVLHVSNTAGEILVRPTIFPKHHYAKFSDTTQQTAALANTAYEVTFDTEDISCSHLHIDANDSANVVISEQGLYEFSFRLQAVSTNSSRSNLWMWARKNGTDIANSATKVSIESNGGVVAPALSFMESMAANDVFQLVWATDSTNVSLDAPAATAFAPATPSAELTVRQVAL